MAIYSRPSDEAIKSMCFAHIVFGKLFRFYFVDFGKKATQVQAKEGRNLFELSGFRVVHCHKQHTLVIFSSHVIIVFH